MFAAVQAEEKDNEFTTCVQRKVEEKRPGDLSFLTVLPSVTDLR